MPISILFTAVATVYFAMNFDFTKAIKLGILAGVMIGIAFSLLMALIILIIRIIRAYKIRTKILTPTAQTINSPIILDPTIYEKKHQSAQANLANEATVELDSIEEKFMLLMDKELAYEVSLNSISHQNIGDIIHQNKEEGSILLRSKHEEIKINISSLTKHTAQVLISSTIDNSNMKNIISMLKEKEHSFMQY
jgi:hypothetical protein